MDKGLCCQVGGDGVHQGYYCSRGGSRGPESMLVSQKKGQGRGRELGINEVADDYLFKDSRIKGQNRNRSEVCRCEG